MTTRVLGIDLHDAGRDGVYRVDPDDPVTLVGDAERAGLTLARIDLADCRDEAGAPQRIATQAGLPQPEQTASTLFVVVDSVSGGLCIVALS